jgi:subtilisin-like proprotein convertase family protein
MRPISFPLAIAAIAMLLLAPSAAGGTPFSNTSPITIPLNGVANPYPSTLAVSGLNGVISNVTVTVRGLSHTYPDDVGLLLVGPTGAKVELMDGAGDTAAASNLTLTFADAGVASLPCAIGSSLASGTFKPTDCYPSQESYPAPAPPGPHGQSLSAFNGTNPNGTWRLYVSDFSSGDGGSIASGWTLDVTVAAPTAVHIVTFRARAINRGVELRWRTAAEAGLLGFNVYREAVGRRVRLNRSLIAAHGTGAGSSTSYRFIDRGAKRGTLFRYRLEAVANDRSRRAVALARFGG